MRNGGSNYSFLERVQGRYRRTCARWLSQRPQRLHENGPVVSFTFDDFPRSSLHVGGEILKRYGGAGTYYAAMSLMGTQAPTGTMFVAEDLETLFREGHELGCHTYEHCNPWETSGERFAASLDENQRALTALFPHAVFRSMSYPFTVPAPRNKRIAGRHFRCCRGRGERSNTGQVDASFLASCFLEMKLGGPEVALKAIEENRGMGGWLIFSTHDLSDDPTPYGWRPDYFETVVRAAAESGARILPVIEAWEQLTSSIKGA